MKNKSILPVQFFGGEGQRKKNCFLLEKKYPNRIFIFRRGGII
jgi:hypothetical protein